MTCVVRFDCRADGGFMIGNLQYILLDVECFFSFFIEIYAIIYDFSCK